MFWSELVEYLIKFIALGLIAFAGIKCGIGYKKNKLKNDSSQDSNDK